MWFRLQFQVHLQKGRCESKQKQQNYFVNIVFGPDQSNLTSRLSWCEYTLRWKSHWHFILLLLFPVWQVDTDCNDDDDFVPWLLISRFLICLTGVCFFWKNSLIFRWASTVTWSTEQKRKKTRQLNILTLTRQLKVWCVLPLFEKLIYIVRKTAVCFIMYFILDPLPFRTE